MAAAGSLRIASAIARAIEFSRKARQAVPVRQVARQVLIETDSEPDMFDSLMDTTCKLAIERGLAIEFSRATEQ